MSAAWLDLMARLERLGSVAGQRLDPGVRHVALLQVARAAEEVAVLATLLAEVAEGGKLAPGDVRAELDRLARDLEVLSGAAILLDARPDQESTAVVLRLVDRHGAAAAGRARLVLSVSPGHSGDGRSDRKGPARDPGVVGGVPS